MYPTEEIERRNRWQDEYDATTREYRDRVDFESYLDLYADDDDALDCSSWPNHDPAEHAAICVSE